MAFNSIRQNFSSELEKAFNEQINAELFASYTYLSMAAYAGRDMVSLPGLKKFCIESSADERNHAEKLIDHVNTRGGKVTFSSIAAPEHEWKSGLNIMESIVNMECDVNERLLKLHQVAERSHDPEAVDFIEGEFLRDQVKDMKLVSDMLTQLKRAGSDGLGLFLWDKELLD